MKEELDQLLEQITTHPLFLRLKSVIENGQGWHDHEVVFDHCVKTSNIAKQQRDGNFIVNAQAKKLFENWMEENIDGIKRKEVVVITALLHDCGKILDYKEDGATKSLVTQKPNFPQEVMCPGHEYWGANLVVPEILKDISIPEKVKESIAKVIEFHDTFSNPYFPSKSDWNLSEIINDTKARTGGNYKETMFNMYCDGYTATAFAQGKRKIEEIFNTPSFYIPRTYFIP